MLLVILLFSAFSCELVKSHLSDVKGDLVFSQILYRHGDRTPVEPYPTDPWRDLKYWPTGWGQLTNTGKMQHYRLGKWLRDRYRILLNDIYSSDNLYVQSTDVDRTLMSALSNLAGLYPPVGREVWDTDIAWQPIPVHTIPEKQDLVLAAKKPCPAYDHAISELLQSEPFQKMDRQFNWLYRYLTKNTGQKVNTLEAVERIYNTLYIEELYDKRLPDWTRKVYPGGDMEWISTFCFAISTYTRELARLKTGPLLKEIFQRFQEKASSKLKPNRSLWVYSAHDTTVASLLNTLKLFEPHSPPYTACILMEMRTFNGTAYVSIFYKNTTEVPAPLFIPKCGIACPLAKMVELYSDVLPDNWETECEMSLLSMTYEEADVGSAMGILFIIALVFLLAISVYTCFVYYRRKSYSYFDYHTYRQINS